MAVIELTCARCGAQFHSPVKRGPRPRFCGDVCRGFVKSEQKPKKIHQCDIDGCMANAVTAGLCTLHYQRKRAYGDPNAPAMVTKPCEYCGAEFTGRRVRRWCGWKCRSRSMGVKAATEILGKAACRQTHTCEHCRGQFQPKRAGRATFCSRACAFAHRTANALPSDVLIARRQARGDSARKTFEPISCRACGERFTPLSKRHYFCSGACRPSQKRDDAERVELCKDCGAECMVAKWGHRRCASCADKRHAASRVRQVEKSKASGVRAAHRKARKIKVRGVRVEPVNPLTVLSRDGWRCQLCGIATPRKLRGTFEPNAPEVDHIVPIAQGGEHSYRNTQCACRKCNITKGAKILGQMRLFA